MKFLALLSGGKDSIYAALEGVKYGHKLACIGNLYPEIPQSTVTEESSSEVNNQQSTDIDSYMFQTVGVEIIPLIAEGMKTPLIRKPITGGSVNQELFYEKDLTKEDDEVEDLYELIKEAKEIYQIEAVCSGAILSDYQRLRIENIGDRLCLVSLSYLWQRDQSELLDEMIENELDARFVKIACIGLKQSYLMESISSMRGDLQKLKEMYQINVGGEGGEYETMVLDCPLYINYKIKVEEFKILKVTEDDYAPVAHVIITKCSLEEKEIKGGNIELYPIEEHDEGHGIWPKLPKDIKLSIKTEDFDYDFRKIYLNKNSFSTAFLGLHTFDIELCPDLITDEIDLLMSKIQELLEHNHLGLNNVTKVVLYIKKMSTFININQIYKHYFKFKPPTRICVAQPVDSDFNIMMELHGVIRMEDIKVLHVQSVSCWAPANIGPYSQACRSPMVTHYAGQIGLDPARMILIYPTSLKQLTQSFKNFERVLNCMGNTFDDVIQCIAYCKSDAAHKDKIEERVKDKLPQCPTLYLGVKELPKNAKVELSMVSMKSELKKDFWEKQNTIEVEGIQTKVFHQHLEIDNKGEIDVVALDFESDAVITKEYFIEILKLTINSGLDEDNLEDDPEVLNIFYERELTEYMCEFRRMLAKCLEKTIKGLILNCIPVQGLANGSITILRRKFIE